jgi:hypothetical protein
MKRLEHQASPLNAADLPLFVWATVAERRFSRPLSLPARRIRDRFGLSAAAAVITAELAGFTMGER